MPAGRFRVPRLDPSALPVRFAAPDAAADGLVRLVEIHPQHVLVSRSVRGMAVRVRVPVEAFTGIEPRASRNGIEAAVLTLQHADPALSIDVFAAADDAEAAVIARLWANVLGLPVLDVAPAAQDAEDEGLIDGLSAGVPAQRRRRRNAIARRRRIYALRRKAGVSKEFPKIYTEREIIARH